MHLLSQLPSFTSAQIWLVGAVVVLVIVLGFLLSALQSARKNLAEEIRRELAATAQPSPVAVQQPLMVAPHDANVAKSEHDKLEKKLEAETAKQTSARKGIYQKLDEHSSRLAALESARISTEKAFESIEAQLADSKQLTTDLRLEVKDDMKGLNNRITDVLAIVKTIEGKISQ